MVMRVLLVDDEIELVSTLAERLSISRTLVKVIRRRKVWAHVP